jgi:hypothetical protein
LRVGQIRGFQQEWKGDAERIHATMHPVHSVTSHMAAESARIRGSDVSDCGDQNERHNYWNDCARKFWNHEYSFE